MIQEEDAKFFNKLHAAEGSVDPLYTQEDVAGPTLSLLQPRPYESPISIADGVDASFSNAGHRVGIGHGPRGVKTLKRKRPRCSPAIWAVAVDPDGSAQDSGPCGLPDHRDQFYGGRRHGAHRRGRKLADVVNQSEKDEGPILIPSFALERTQELVLSSASCSAKRIKPTSHFTADSPMATTSQIFEKNRGAHQPVRGVPPERRAGGDPFGLKTIPLRALCGGQNGGHAGPKIIMAGSHARAGAFCTTCAIWWASTNHDHPHVGYPSLAPWAAICGRGEAGGYSVLATTSLPR